MKNEETSCCNYQMISFISILLSTQLHCDAYEAISCLKLNDFEIDGNWFSDSTHSLDWCSIIEGTRDPIKKQCITTNKRRGDYYESGMLCDVFGSAHSQVISHKSQIDLEPIANTINVYYATSYRDSVICTAFERETTDITTYLDLEFNQHIIDNQALLCKHKHDTNQDTRCLIAVKQDSDLLISFQLNHNISKTTIIISHWDSILHQYKPIRTEHMTYIRNTHQYTSSDGVFQAAFNNNSAHHSPFSPNPSSNTHDFFENCIDFKLLGYSSLNFSAINIKSSVSAHGSYHYSSAVMWHNMNGSKSYNNECDEKQYKTSTNKRQLLWYNKDSSSSNSGSRDRPWAQSSSRSSSSSSINGHWDWHNKHGWYNRGHWYWHWHSSSSWQSDSVETTKPTSRPTNRPTYKPTSRPTNRPTNRPAYNPTLRPTKLPSFTPSQQPSWTPSHAPTTKPSRAPISANKTHNPTIVPTLTPSTNPTVNPSINPTISPTYIPTPQPTSTPTADPSYVPSSTPTTHPSFTPSHQPTPEPTAKPSPLPTADPTINPTIDPTANPSDQPTPEPTHKPTPQTTPLPSRAPLNVDNTHNPTVTPTNNPTMNPVIHPTVNPTYNPTTNPTNDATTNLTNDATTNNPTTNLTNDATTNNPTDFPTPQPTDFPSDFPTWDPSVQPTHVPSLTVLEGVCCNCTTATTEAGCSSDKICERIICDIDSFCCDDKWDEDCVDGGEGHAIGALYICINGIPQTSSTPSNKPTPAPTAIAGALEVYIAYNETRDAYWTQSVERQLEYAYYVQTAIWLSYKNTTGYSLDYGDLYVNEAWNYGGIIDWIPCFIFDTKLANVNDCPYYDTTLFTKDAQFVSVNEFYVIADQNVMQFKRYIMQQLQSKILLDYMSDLLNSIINLATHDTDTANRRLLQQDEDKTEVISIHVVDKSNISDIITRVPSSTTNVDTTISLSSSLSSSSSAATATAIITTEDAAWIVPDDPRVKANIIGWIIAAVVFFICLMVAIYWLLCCRQKHKQSNGYNAVHRDEGETCATDEEIEEDRDPERERLNTTSLQTQEDEREDTPPYDEKGYLGASQLEELKRTRGNTMSVTKDTASEKDVAKPESMEIERNMNRWKSNSVTSTVFGEEKERNVVDDDDVVNDEHLKDVVSIVDNDDNDNVRIVTIVDDVRIVDEHLEVVRIMDDDDENAGIVTIVNDDKEDHKQEAQMTAKSNNDVIVSIDVAKTVKELNETSVALNVVKDRNEDESVDNNMEGEKFEIVNDGTQEDEDEWKKNVNVKQKRRELKDGGTQLRAPEIRKRKSVQKLRQKNVVRSKIGKFEQIIKEQEYNKADTQRTTKNKRKKKKEAKGNDAP